MTAVLTPNTDAQSITREDPPTSPRVLMLTHRLPYPPDRGDRIRSYHMLKELARHFEVGIACTSDEPVWLQHHQLLSTIAKRVAIQPISVHASKIASLGAFITGRSITPSYYYRQGLADTILQWHEEAPFDVVLTFCTGMIRYARLLVPGPAGRPQPKATNTTPSRHILDLVDVDSLKWDSYAQQTWPPMRWAYRAEARRLGKIEAGKSDRFDAVTVISDAEAEAYRNQIVDHPGLTVVNNGVDLDYFETLPDADTKTLVFVGVLNYKPNAEGITWFVQHVMGLLRRQLPDARLLIIGRHPTPRIEELAHQPGVEVIGSVPDVRIYLREACAAIAPLRIARGVQNKVLEAMACNRAVVCSTQAAQGLRARHEEHLLVADTAQQWVDHLYRVMTDTETRQRIATAARRQVEDCYSWESCLRPIVQLIRGDQPPLNEGD